MIRARVYGDVIDLADEVIDDTVPIVKKAANKVSDAFLRMVKIAAPRDTGELADKMRRRAASVRGRTVIGGIRHQTMTFEEVNSIEYGAVGPNGRVSKARAFVRPAEAKLDREAAAIFEAEL